MTSVSRQESTALMITIILVLGIAFFLSSTNNQGLVVVHSIKSTQSSVESFTFDFANPVAATASTRYVLSPTNFWDETTTYTLVPIRDGTGKQISSLKTNVKKSVSLDQLIAAQEHMATQAVKAMPPIPFGSIQFQSVPPSAPAAAPGCERITSGTMFQGGTHRICPGTYHLTSPFSATSDTTLIGNNVIVDGPGTCTQQGTVYSCMIGFVGWGKNIAISGFTFTNWGRAMAFLPSYVLNPTTSLWSANASNSIVHDVSVTHSSRGIGINQDSFQLFNSTFDVEDYAFTVDGYWDIATNQNVKGSADVHDNTFTIVHEVSNPAKAIQKPNTFFTNDMFTVHYATVIQVHDNSFSLTSSCAGCIYETGFVYDVDNFSFSTNTASKMTLGLNVQNSNNWYVGSNTFALSKTKGTTAGGGLFTDGGGTIYANTFTGDGLGAGISHSYWTDSVICSDKLTQTASNTFDHFEYGYFHTEGASFAANQGNCTLGITIQSPVSTNNFLTNTTQIQDPTGPNVVVYGSNYFKGFNCNPAGNNCQNLFPINTQKNSTAVTNPWP